MYRYFVFAFNDYYPSGGFGDCELKTNELNEAKEKLEEFSNYDASYIYDAQTDEIIE